MARQRPPTSPPAAIDLRSADLSRMSKNERLKAGSEGLFWVAGRERHSFASEIASLEQGERETLSSEAREIAKFFGIYAQQERIEGRKGGAFIFMVRVCLPAGGELSPAQWAALDGVSDAFSNRTIRLTSRQAIQFHHISGRDLASLVRALVEGYAGPGNELPTLGACGDVNRNVMCSPIDDLDAELPLTSGSLARAIAKELAPVAGASAYRQAFLEDSPQGRSEPGAVDEPVYGEQYLPRKFKVGIAHPHDGSIDLLTQDVGLLPVVGPDAVAAAYDLYSGGGMGTTHNNPRTQALLGMHLGRIPREQVVAATRAIAILQKENGDRKDRRAARWKYTIRRLGLKAVTHELRDRFGIALESAEPQPLPPNRFFHGWHPEAGDGKHFFLGLPVLSGRLSDGGDSRHRSCVREVVSALGLGVRLTPNQDLLLTHVPAAERDRVEAILADHGVPRDVDVPVPRRQALACPARPTCGLAMTDAEKVLPGYLDAIERAGYGDVDVVIRVSGCPNGCPRPPTAEIGISGYGKNDHIIQVGGSRQGSRIGKVLYRRIPEQDVSRVLIGLMRAIRDENPQALPAGDLLHQTPVEDLREIVGIVEE